MQNDKYLPPEAPTHGYAEPPQHGYPPQTGYHPQPGYTPHTGYPPPQGYPPQQGFPPQQGYPQPGYPPASYPAQNYVPPQQGYIPPPQGYVPPPPQAAVPPNGWYNRNQRNKPQSNAVAAASFIFISGGMNIAWSVGFRGLIFYLAPLHTHLAWFIGAIIGAVITSFLTNKVPKKFLMISGSVLVIVGGIAAAATQYNRQAVEACLYLDGIANGLVFAPAMALAGEVTVPYMRGTISASIEQMSFGVGFFIQVIYTGSWGFSYSPNDSFTQEQLHGVLSAVFGLIGLVLAATVVVESPVIMLANGQEEQAIDSLRRLQRPAVVTTETYEQLEEHKRYLAENKELSLGTSIAQGLPALVRLIFLRTLLAMSLSIFVTNALLISVGNSIAMHSTYWEFTVYAICRWLGTLITSFCMESLGRKKPTLFGLLISGGLAFGIGSMLGDYPYGPLDSIFYLIIVYQIFAGIAFTATSCYLSEAYPLGVKQHYIGITFIVEMLVYIIISSSDYSASGGSIYFYILGAFSVGAGLLGIWFLPETRGISLREAQNKFKGFISNGF